MAGLEIEAMGMGEEYVGTGAGAVLGAETGPAPKPFHQILHIQILYIFPLIRRIPRQSLNLVVKESKII